MFRSISVVAALLVTSVIACDRPAEKDQEKATEAQREADQKIAEARKESTTKTTSAQVEADKKIAEAQANFAKTREDYRHSTENDLTDLNKKIDVMEADAKKATGKAKADAEATLRDIRVRRDAYKTDRATLDSASATTWDNTKARLDKEWDALKASVNHAPSP